MLNSHYKNSLMRSGFALREAYVAILPYLIINSLVTMLFELLRYAEWATQYGQAKVVLMILQDSFPILLVISIAYQLAKLYRLDRMLTITLAVTLFLTVVAINKLLQGISDTDNGQASIAVLVIPIAATALLRILLNIKWLVPKVYATLDNHVMTANQYIVPFIFSYVLILGGWYGLQLPCSMLLAGGSALIEQLQLTSNSLLLVRTFWAHCFWLIGVHGENTFDLLLNNQSLNNDIFPGLTAKMFFDLFVFGGAGSSWALAIAIVWLAKDRHASAVVRTGLPFLVFNINEIIIYGLPIVFNRQLAIAFVMVPLVNLALAYSALSFGIVKLGAINGSLAWTTPIFLNAYFLVADSKWLIALQGGLLALDVALYYPFVKRFLMSQSSSESLHVLETKLEISTHIESKRGLNFQKAQTHIVESHVETNKVIELITENELQVFYQPKVCVSDLSCHHFESLLRLKMRDGRVVGPYFLDVIEMAGLAPVIDLWVSKQVAKDIRKWSMTQPVKVSINLHPDTLGDTAVLLQIVAYLQGLPIQFEILEKAVISSAGNGKNIQLLNELGFELAIDDFGTGYSSVESLFQQPIKVIKLDKFLADQLMLDKGVIVYRHLCAMLKDLGFILVAEGIETKQQLDIVTSAGVDYVQGFYFSQALSLDQARNFEVKHVLDNVNAGYSLNSV